MIIFLNEKLGEYLIRFASVESGIDGMAKNVWFFNGKKD
jgi:hypothetical protein